MAQLTHLRCPSCGWLRLPHVFGLDGDFNFVEAPEHPTTMSIQNIGGRGRCSWEHHDVPLHASIALCKSLRASLARLEAEVRAAGGGAELDADD